MPIEYPDREPRRTLVREYAVATQHYAWAVAEVDRQRPAVPEEEHRRLYKIVEDAHSECERLRTALQKLPGI